MKRFISERWAAAVAEPLAGAIGLPQCRRVRLLMFAFNFPPAATAGVHRSLRFAKYLHAFNCHPTVLTRNCSGDPGGEALLGQVASDVEIVRVGYSKEPPAVSHSAGGEEEGDQQGDDRGGSAPIGRRLVKTIKDLLRPARDLLTETPDQYVGWSRQAAARGIELCRQASFDAIYTTGPPHSTHLAGLKVHRRTGLPWIADFRDPWARRPWTKVRNPWGQRLLPYLERKVARSASRIVLNNDASAEDFRRAYPDLPPEKFIAIPNGYDPELLQVMDELQHARRKIPTAGARTLRTPVLCHPGTLYGQRNPQAILQAIGQLHRRGTEVRFQQVGFVGPRFNLLQMARAEGIEHLVECVPPVAHREAMQYMAHADILMILQPNGPLMVPGKLYEMLLFDQPILGVCDSIASTQVLRSAGNAWSVGSQDADVIAGALEEILRGDTITEAAERAAARDRYNGRDLAARLSEVIHSAVAAAVVQQ